MPSAIIVGAGPGIGTAVARRVAREGLAVGVLARSAATVAAAEAAVRAEDAETSGARADVIDEHGLRAALDALVERLGVHGWRLHTQSAADWQLEVLHG